MYRNILVILAGILLGFSASAQTSSWPTPNKPITFINPFPPGGAVDAFGRPLAKQLSTQLNDSIVVDNRGGAGGTLGAAVAAKMAPDGYAWLLGAVHHSIAPSMYTNLSYDITKDFEPIAIIGSVPHVIVVNPNKFPKNDLKSIMEEIRKHPGKYNYASTGNGTSQHLTGELFKLQNKLFITHIPYRGTGPALQDLVAGQVDMMFATASAVGSLIESGKLRALAVTTSVRSTSPVLAKVPTIAESGLPGYVSGSWYGFFAPGGTPSSIIATLNGSIKKAAQSKIFKDRVESEGLVISTGTPEDFGKFVKAEELRWKEVIKKANIKSD